jgi:uracil-DNA glycosylase family 4
MLSRPFECRGCALDDKATGFSQPEGLGSLGVLVFGEALGASEARDGKPFRPYAQAGSLLERTIGMCGLDRQQFRLYNIVNCQPPRDWLEGAPWELGAIAHCQVHRDRIVEEQPPRAILALGNVALRTITGQAGKSRGITYLRGYVLPSVDWGGIPVVPSFHPSYLRRGKPNLINVLVADIRKAISIASGKLTNFCLRPDLEAGRYVQYQTKVTTEEARSFELLCADSLAALLAFDIETDNSMFVDEDADDDVQLEIDAGQISQIQFSLGVGKAIAMPWREPFKSIAKRILMMKHVKAGHNAWRFDLPVLKREGATVAGIVHDTRWMWHHLQPDLPAHLQFVASFYEMPFPWKHLAQYDEEFYGCGDGDAVSRIMARCPDQLKKKDVWRGYERHILGREPILLGMTRRGIPIDDVKRQELDVELTAERERVREETQALWPTELIKFHPPNGYVRPPKDKTGLIQRDFSEHVKDPNQQDMFDAPVIRWCQQVPFNPGSRDQVIEYIEYMKEKFPRKGYAVPKKYRSEDLTTEENELLKLIRKTKDPMLPLVLNYREHEKMRSTYVLGWTPGPDGCVHPSFNHGTPVGQLNSKGPNAQNFPKRKAIAKKMREMIRAKEGHKLIEFDFSAFHAVTLAFEAQSVNWMRLARSDIHSFTTAHFLKLPERDQLLDWPDDQLKEYLAWVKEKYGETRDNKAKHAILGVGNGLGYRKLYRQYSDFFEGEKEAKTLLDTIRGIFPEVFQYQNRRRREAHERTYLTTRFGYIRWFFDVMHWNGDTKELVPGEDSEAALCFNHVNDAFGHMNEQFLWLRDTELDARFELVNTIHDSLFFHPVNALVDECIERIHAQMILPSPVLIDPVTAPTGLAVDVEVKIGDNWRIMSKIDAHQPT